MITSPPAEISAREAARPAPLLSRIASWIDRKPGLVLPVWIFAYVAVLWRPAHRPLWFDELFTFYIAKSPTWERFFGGIRAVDLNPPLSYLLVRWSMALFGDSAFAVRLPSMLGFLAAGLIVFWLVKRRLGGAIGLAALGIFWSSSLTRYAVEARPYGLLLALFAVATLCWMSATRTDRWSMWHTGLAAAIVGMFLTHCFSPVFAAALGVGELVRSVVSRRIDRRVWAALVLPLVILPLYLPLVGNARAVLWPPKFAATLITIPKFYLAVGAPLLPAIGAIVVLWLATHGRGSKTLWTHVARPHEIAFSIAAILAPLVPISYSLWSGSPFWPRYGIGAIVGGTLILAALLAVAARLNSTVSAGMAVLILVLFCVTRAGTGSLVEQYDNSSTAYRATRPELPFVAASGLTFLEMDHREESGFLSRVYYLTDPASAVRYHTSIFEGMPILKQWFPVRAGIAPYLDFTSRNPQFLVLATKGFPEDWLLPKLAEDGAQIRLLHEENTGYRDRELYEVTLR